MQVQGTVYWLGPRQHRGPLHVNIPSQILQRVCFMHNVTRVRADFICSTRGPVLMSAISGFDIALW